MSPEDLDGLHEQAMNFAVLFRCSPLAIIISTLEEGRITEANESFLRLCDLSREQVVGRTGLELGLWAGEAIRRAAIGALRLQGRVRNVEMTFRLPNRRVLYVLMSAEVVQYGGRPCLLSMGVDVTERRRAEETIERLTSIVECHDDAIFSVAVDGTVTSWNQGAVRLTGWTAEEAVGRPVSFLAPAEHPQEHVGQMARLFRGEQVRQAPTTCVGRDGSSRSLLLTLIPVVDNTGGIAGISAIMRQDRLAT